MSIILENVSFTYAVNTPHEKKAINNISLDINDGDYVGIMGKTGCGKSTLIQLIDGLLTPSEGKIIFNDKDINAQGYDRDILRKNIGIVFQFPEHQLFETTVKKDVAFGLKHHGLPPGQVELQVREAVETMGFNYDEVKDLSPLTFSGGEKRRIAIAGILAIKPTVLILDEPIAGLDPTAREIFLRITDRINSEGTTVIMISHNADVIIEHTKKVLILKDGGLLRYGPTDEIFSETGLLKENNIGIGQINELCELLRKMGKKIPKTVIRYDDFISNVLSWRGIV